LTRETSKRKEKEIQIRVIADDPEVTLAILKKIVLRLRLKNATITGVFPNRKEPGYRGYILAEVDGVD